MPEHISEYRYVELEHRAVDGALGTVDGVVVRYGDEAVFPWGRERIMPGAFGADLAALDLMANRMHNRDQPLARTGSGLSVADSEVDLRGQIVLPATIWGQTTDTEVRIGLLRGLSLESRVLAERVVNQVREVMQARLYGWGVVDRPAYPDSGLQIRNWSDYLRYAEQVPAYQQLEHRLWQPEARCAGCGAGVHPAQRGEQLGNLLHRLRDEQELTNAQLGKAAGISASTIGGILSGAINCPPAARLSGLADLLDVPVGDLVTAAEADGCSYDEHNAEINFVEFPPEATELRQVDGTRVAGSLPYGVDGVVSMARGEYVRFLPGSLTDSLAGEIMLLAGNSYDDVLASTIAGNLRLRDTDEALKFVGRKLPNTTYAENFISKLNAGLVRGVTAGWANAGSVTTTEDLPNGGKRIVVQTARLCEMRLRTRSAFDGERVVAQPDPDSRARRWLVG